MGFLANDRTGYIDLAFFLPSAARRGVGHALLEEAERWAKVNGAIRLTTEASLVARPFFLKNSWHQTDEEDVGRMGARLTRFKMMKDVR